MKTNLTLILFILFPFFVNYIEAAMFTSSGDDVTLYKYNLVKADTYVADSGFDESTPVKGLWDNSVASGVNDSKAFGNTEAWIEFDFEGEEEISEAGLWQDHGGNRVTDWKVMYWTTEGWKNAFEYVTCTALGWQTQTFDVTTTKVRFYAKCNAGTNYVSIHEIQLYTKLSPVKRKTVIGCVGDSNTWNDGGTGEREAYSWPAQISKILGNEYQVENLGVSGATLMKSGNTPWISRAQYTIHKELYSNISIIALGTNDSKDVNWNSTQFKSDYIDLIQEFQNYPTKPEIYMLIPIKAYSTTGSIKNDVISNQIRPIMRDISKTYGIAVIDGYNATENMGNLYPDGIHPNAEGLTAIAEKVASVLQTKKPIIVADGQPSETVYAEYYWYKDGILIPDASVSTYMATESGTYKVTVKLNSATDDVIVSESIGVTEPNINLVVSDGHWESNVLMPETAEIKVSNLPDALLIENAVGSDFFMFDIHGKLVKNMQIQNENEKINTVGLFCGIYLYKLGDIRGKILK